jgi:hypothetical protein
MADLAPRVETWVKGILLCVKQKSKLTIPASIRQIVQAEEATHYMLCLYWRVTARDKNENQFGQRPRACIARPN